MTINIQLRKGSVTILTESVVAAALAAREKGEEINVIAYPGAVTVIAEDGATPAELQALLAEAQTSRT